MKPKKIKIDFDGLDMLIKDMKVALFTQRVANLDLFESEQRLWDGITKNCKDEMKKLGGINIQIDFNTKEIGVNLKPKPIKD